MKNKVKNLFDFILNSSVMPFPKSDQNLLKPDNKNENSIGTKTLNVASSQPSNALAGNVAGIIAVQRSGEPGKNNSEFWIRGCIAQTQDSTKRISNFEKAAGLKEGKHEGIYFDRELTFIPYFDWDNRGGRENAGLDRFGMER